jgi:predicted TIM-barrel fold metal-dependent hydrolase
MSLPDGEISIRDVARIFRESPVDRAIISSTGGDMGPTDVEMRAGNRRVAELVKSYPDQFYGYCSVHPHYLEASLKEMDYTVRELGFVGIGEVCPHVLDFEMDSDEVRAIIEKAIELDVPLNLHSSEPPHFLGIAKLAREYPQARISMAHFGGFRFWRDGITAIKHCDNVWADCSAWVLFTMGAFEHTVKTLGAGRVLFGTDFPLCELDMAVYKIRNSGLSEREVDRIGFENAVELFNLEKPS